ELALEQLADRADRQRLAGTRRPLGSGGQCFGGPRRGRRAPWTGNSHGPGLPFQVGELVLADLEIVAARQLVRLDPAPVDVGAVERSQVIDVEAVPPSHEQRVVTRDRDVVQEYPRVRAAADRHAITFDGEA